MNRKHYTNPHDYNNSENERIGGHVVEVIPKDISMIINNFVKERPQKNRGVNIDIFLLKDSFEELIIEKKIESDSSDIVIDKIQRSSIKDVISDRCVLYFIKYKGKLFGDYTSSDAFLLEIDKNSLCLITNFRKPDHSKVSSWIYRRLFPSINRAFLTSSEMRDILKNVAGKGKFDLRMKMDYSKAKDMKKAYIEFYHEEDRKKLPYVDYVFNEKKRVRTFMRLMKIVSVDQELAFTFSGEGHIGIYEGTFDDIFNYLIIPTIESAKERLATFSNRSMSERKEKISLPIKINFYTSIFDNKEKISNFLKKISDYNRCFYSTIHNGNPYLFMYVVDRYDYSSFSLRSEGNDSLIITPQIKTSGSSIMRFTQYILDNFQDGDLITEGTY